MSGRSNLGRSLARRSAAARRRYGLADLADALGLTLDELYPVWRLRLPDGSVVEQRGSDGPDAARRYCRATGIRAVGIGLTCNLTKDID